MSFSPNHLPNTYLGNEANGASKMSVTVAGGMSLGDFLDNLKIPKNESAVSWMVPDEAQKTLENARLIY